MASSLEKLLAEDGFKRKGWMTKSRPSFQAESLPRHRLQEQGRRASMFGDKVKTQRAKSDVARHNAAGELYDPVRNRNEGFRDHFVRMEKSSRELKNEKVEISFDGETYAEEKGFDVHTLLEDTEKNAEIVEVDEEEDIEFEEVANWNAVRNSQTRKENYSHEAGKKLEMEEYRSAKNAVNKKLSHSSYVQYKHGNSNSQRNQWKSVKETESSKDRSNRGSAKTKSIEETHGRVRGVTVHPISEPAIDKVAVRAIISIFNDYIKHFLDDEDFRITLRDNCFSSLNFFEIQEGGSNETNIIMSLEKAIETVERAVEEPDSTNSKDLKKASLQLSVITGLSLNDLKDEFTCGIPNYKLSACAHLYLSVIYKIQKKERVSAKHLLQVFVDSPFQARTTLLPELWDNVFSPHLEHLKVWHSMEVDSLSSAPNAARKLKLLVQLYNEVLNSGTYKFAVYYKDWLTEGTEAPSLPCVDIPPRSMGEAYYEDSPEHCLATASSSGSFSPQPMVSKKLYDAMFNVSHENSYEH